jgi:hypothetical protein
VRAGELLRQLDQRLLPPLARGMTRLSHGPVRLRVLTSAALLSSAAVLVTAVWAADRGSNGDLTVGEVTRVGVSEGQSIPGYVQSSRSELAALVAAPPAGPQKETYALITLAAYLAPDRLAPVLAGVGVSEVFSRVPLPDTQTQIVRIPALRLPDDVVANMAQIALRKDREARDYQERGAALTGDSDEERRLRSLYDSGARVALNEATAYRSRCSCLYAAVVRASPAALQRVAGRPEVRAVDPAPEVLRPERAVFSPPLPEQEDLVRPPSDGALPPGNGVAAGNSSSPSVSPSSVTPSASTGVTPSDTASASPTASPSAEPSSSSPQVVTPSASAQTASSNEVSAPPTSPAGVP